MSTVATEKSAKVGVLEMIQKMPDDATLSDIFDALRFRLALEKSIRQVDSGHVIAHEEVEKRMASWLK